ncbi:MAG: permease-like cell division protein FtsX [Muribaculaceae bacterium]|nr:permease-like cell division protein FtsX [Muribaculaceae bacterium]
MGKHRKSAISTFSAQITSTISVALVLLVLGIVAFLGLVANNVTTDIKENIGFVVVLDDDISPANLNALKQKWGKEPYVASQQFISAEEVLQQESKRMGEDILDMMADINPYQPEFEINVTSQYANSDSIESIKASLIDVPGIENIVTNTSMVDEINVGINNVIIALMVVAFTLILISFVLINNSVRLAIYSKRFIIHTMRLVGATNGFIRRPFVLNNVIHGFIASIIATIILGAILYYLHSIEYSFSQTITWIEAAYVFATLAVLGIILCATAALFATNKYIHTSYDDMFK